MSKLVILEGNLNQKLKDKTTTEVYSVLTRGRLRIYKSRMAYTTSPNAPITVIEFSNEYRLLPSFDKLPVFTLFKKGEKADERLYLEASSKDNYDLWLNEIETAMHDKSEINEKENLMGAPQNAVNDNSGATLQEQPSSGTPSIDVVDSNKSPQVIIQDHTAKTKTTTPREKEAAPTHNKIDDTSIMKRTVADQSQEMGKLKQRISELDVRIGDLTKENSFLKTSLHENYEFSDKQLKKIATDIGHATHFANTDLTSFQILVDHLSSKKINSQFLDSFLRLLLEYLIHECPIEANSDQSLFQYLTTSMEMSPDSISTFVSHFLLTLYSHTNSVICDPPANLSSIILSIVQAVPSSSSSSKKSFQHKALEIAYLLKKMGLEKSQPANGISVPRDIHEEFAELLKTLDIEAVDRVFIVELSLHIKDRYLAKARDVVAAEKKVSEENHIIVDLKHFCENLRAQLRDRESENEDLWTTIREITARNLELESSCLNFEHSRDVDKAVDFHISLSEKLCPSCQINVSDLLNIPSSKMLDHLVDNFADYWRRINDISSFLAKKKHLSDDIKDALNMISASKQLFLTLMSQLQKITGRSIINPEITN